MTRRTAYKRIGWGFLIAAVIYTFGVFTSSDEIIAIAFATGHGIHSVGVANLAQAKGYKGHYCFVFTLLFTLLLGLIVVWVLPDKRADTADYAMRSWVERPPLDT